MWQWTSSLRVWWDTHVHLHSLQHALGALPRPADYNAAVWVTAAVAMVLVISRHTGHPIRNLGTFVHESGHAIAAVLLRLQVSGVRLAHDTSGVTSTGGGGRLRGAMVSWAGCPAGAVVAAGYALALRFSRPAWAAVATGLLVLLVLVLWVRNWWGVWVLLILLGAISLVLWAAPSSWLYPVVMLVMFTLLFGSFLDIANYHRARLQSTDRTNLSFDTYGVARRLHCPAVMVEATWYMAWAVLAALVVLLIY